MWRIEGAFDLADQTSLDAGQDGKRERHRC
jgi:hypothetical protein